MIVTAEFIGLHSIVKAIGKSRLQIGFAGDTFGCLLDELRAKLGTVCNGALLEADGTVHSTVQIILNGSGWIKRDEFDHQLSEGDTVLFLLMMAGG